MGEAALVPQPDVQLDEETKVRDSQGSPSGRTLLMSPAMVAAAAVSGEVVDVRDLIEPPVENEQRNDDR